MEDPIDRGLPFVIGDLWRSPAFADAADENESIFEPLSTALTPLEQLNPGKEDGVAHFGFDIDLLPPLGQNGTPELDLQRPGSAASPPSEVLEGTDTGIWSFDDVTSHSQQPKLYTWEAFCKEPTAYSDRLALLSEAGPAAFDAAVSPFAPPNNVGVLPRDYTLRSLCNLALGRASSLFQWDESKASFVASLDGISISGFSHLSSTSLVDSLVHTGSILARLHGFVEFQQNHPRMLQARSAIRSCLSIMLSAVDESISEEISNVHSLLQLQRLIHRPRRVLDILEKVVGSIKAARDEKSVISQVSKCINDELITDPQLQQVFEILLAQVSVLWFEQLARSIGFPDSANALVLGGATVAGGKEYMDDLPDFVSSEDAVLLRETSEAVRMLRTHSPSHPLITDTGIGDALSPFDCFADADITYGQVEEYSQQYKKRSSSTRLPICPSFTNSRQPAPQSADYNWAEVADQASYLSALEVSMSGKIKAAAASGGQLYEQTLVACRGDTQSLEPDPASVPVDCVIAPLDRVRPLIITQHRLVNTVLLRQLFREHHLVDHFDVQRQFHLFGNGEFVTRLSTALFSVDVQSAERRRGKMPTAETMGLRLGTTHEERWPPASSELQLTLMGILAEAYGGTKQRNSGSHSTTGKLPGGLSFAIRQLPENDIERVLDPNSIYALDFLRLQYIAKSPLDAIFTAAALDSYDQIFRFFLRLLRLTHVTTTLQRKAQAVERADANISARCFTIQARTFVTVLAAHMVDVGATAPWQTFEKEIRQIEQDLNDVDGDNEPHFSVRVGIQGLRQLHDACLERMRSRLFLKKKQEKVRVAIENVLSTILKTTFALQKGSISKAFDLKQAQAELHRSIQTLHLSLRSVADRPVKDATSPEAEDAEMAGLLLLKLNWNSFYNDAT